MVSTTPAATVFFTYKVSCLPIYEMIDYDGNSWGRGSTVPHWKMQS